MRTEAAVGCSSMPGLFTKLVQATLECTKVAQLIILGTAS
jgi:hypothetical protein